MKNPIRRSRKIGKTQGGRVQDGKASEKWSRIFTEDIWMRLSESNLKWQILKENPSRDYYHPCQGDEYIEVLKQLPRKETDGLRAIVLRRTPKFDLKLGIEAQQRYYCVILNSFPKSNTYSTKKKQSQSIIKHYKNWCSNWEQTETGWNFKWKVEEVRRYYLYYLFLHELGHLNQPYYYTRKRAEDFAHNYALEWARKLNQL